MPKQMFCVVWESGTESVQNDLLFAIGPSEFLIFLVPTVCEVHM